MHPRKHPPRRGALSLARCRCGTRPAVVAAEAAEAAGISLERLQRLDALLEREIAAGRLSGMVVAVARHGEVIQRNYGYMDLESREPMRADAMFRLYSMTKPIASVALLTLYEQGSVPAHRSARQVHPAVRRPEGVCRQGRERPADSRNAEAQAHDPRRIPPHAGVVGWLGQHRRRRAIPRGGARHVRARFAAPGDRSPCDGAVALFAGRPVGVRARSRRAGVSRRAFLRHALCRLRAQRHPRAARHAPYGIRRAAGDEARLRHRVQPRRGRQARAGHRRSLRALHGARLRHAEPVRVGAGLPALRADAAERRRAGRRTHSRPQDGGAHGAEPPAAEHSVDCRQRTGRDRATGSGFP